MTSTSDDETLQVWGAATGKRLRELTSDLVFPDYFLVSADGKTLALRKNNGSIAVQDMVSARQLSEIHLDVPRRGLGLAALTRDGKLIATISRVKEPRGGRMREPEEMAIDLWDAGVGKMLRRVATYKRWGASFLFAPDSFRNSASQPIKWERLPFLRADAFLPAPSMPAVPSCVFAR